MFVFCVCCFCVGSYPFVELITRLEVSYRVCVSACACVIVCAPETSKGAAWTRFELVCPRKKVMSPQRQKAGIFVFFFDNR
jgi:hypothetical protein